MRADEYALLSRIVHRVQTDLDTLLAQENVEHFHADIMDIALRCRTALMKEAA